MNVTLIDPPPLKIVETHDAPDCPRLGLAYIAGFLKDRGIKCNVIDAKFGVLRLIEVEEKLRKQKPDIVGITAMTHEVTQADIVAGTVKKISPNALVVLGGPHATALPARTLKEFANFDVTVSGEGELTLYELVTAVSKRLDFDLIRGITYRINNEIRVNKPREFNSELDELPFPAWDEFPKSETYSIVTARGCPFNCNFCMRVLGNKVRRRAPQNIINEMERDIEKFGARYIHFWDETFGINKQYTYELLDLMLERGFHKKIQWDAETRVDVGDYELFCKMKAAGCDKVGFGIESGNEDILRATGKGINKDLAINCVRMAKKAGLKTQSYFIIGHPYETRKTISETIKLATKLNTSTVAFGIMVPYPGTQIYEKARVGEGGYKIISADWKDYNKTIGNSMELDSLPRKELERQQLRAYLQFYFGNFRYFDLIKLFLSQSKVVLQVIKKIFA